LHPFAQRLLAVAARTALGFTLRSVVISVEVMHCQTCRRSIPPKATRCLYCGGAPSSETKPSVRCPDCRGEMHTGDRGGVPASACGACSGLWFHRGDLERAVVAARKDGPVDRWSHLPSPVDVHAPQRSCPVCRQVMLRKNFQGSGVIVDVCGAHGVFLDRGELERIAAHEPKAQAPERPARVSNTTYRHERHVYVDGGMILADTAVSAVIDALLDW
jgi:Zn-finger nucleic acid-binding protein